MDRVEEYDSILSRIRKNERTKALGATDNAIALQVKTSQAITNLYEHWNSSFEQCYSDTAGDRPSRGSSTPSNSSSGRKC